MIPTVLVQNVIHPLCYLGALVLEKDVHTLPSPSVKYQDAN